MALKLSNNLTGIQTSTPETTAVGTLDFLKSIGKKTGQTIESVFPGVKAIRESIEQK